jgi:hypothetical protein
MKTGSRCVLLSRVGCFFLAFAALGMWAAGPGTGTAQAQVVASDAQAQFPVGGLTIALPAPTGQEMVELGGDRHLFDPAVPDSNRLIAAFLLKKDVATLLSGGKGTPNPYAFVEVLRTGEYMSVSGDDFKGMADSIAKQTGDVVDSTFKEGEEEFNRKMKAMDLNVQVTYGKPVMLGTFFYKTDAYAFGMIAPVTADGQTTNMIVGTVLLRVKDRVLFAYYYSAYQNDETPGQVRAASERWADAILAANAQ